MAGSLAELMVSIIGDVSDVRKAFDEVDKSTGALGKSITSLGNDMSNMGKSMSMYITAPLALMGAGAFKVAADFDDSMRKVQAVTGETGDSLTVLRDAALQMGADTAFSSSQAADAMLQLGQAGFTADEILTSTNDVLSLASAGALDLGTAAGITANAMNGFGLEAEDTQRIVDVLAKGASISTTTVEGLGNALSYVAPVASAMGMSLEETTSIIAALSNAGIEGERAGTALRGAISRLAAPSNEAAKALERYGLSLDDVNPATHTFTEILDTLAEAGIDTAGVMEIFGQEAGPGVLALLGQGTGAIKEQTLALQNSKDAAQQMAETMEGGVGGAMRQLQGSVETLAIKIGDLTAKALIPLADILIDAFNWMSSLPEPVLTLVVAMAGLAAAIGPVLIVAGTLISSIGTISTAIAGAGGLSAVLTAVVGILTGPVAIAIAAFAAAAYIVYKNWDTVGPLVQRTFDTIVNAVRPTAEVIMDFVTRTCASLSAWWATNGPAIMQAVGRVSDFLISMFGAMAAVIWYFTSGPLKGLWEAFQQAVNIIIPILDYLGKQVGNTIMLVVNLINGDWSAAWQNARNIVNVNFEAIKSIVSAGLNAILGFHISILNSIYSHIQSIWNSIRSYISGVLNGISSDTTGTWNRILSIITGVLNSIYSAISSILSRVSSLWSSQFNGLSSITSSVMSAVARVISGSGSSLAAAASSAGQQAVNAMQAKLSQINLIASQIRTAVDRYNQYQSLLQSSSGGSSGSSSGSSGSTGIKRQGSDGTGEENVKIREAHATGGLAGYTGWHWMEEKELAVPEKFDWDGVLTSSLSKALKSVASSGVSNSYAGDTVINVNATLTPQYNFEALMRDIERELSKNKTRRGILS